MKIKIDLTDKEKHWPIQALRMKIGEYLSRHGMKIERIEKLNPKLVEVETDSK